MKRILSLLLALMLLAGSATVLAAGEFPAKSTWTIVASDARYPASDAIDGKLTTYWHSNYDVEGGTPVNPTPCPHNLYITLPAATEFSGVRLYPRKEWNAHVTEVNVYISDAAENTADHTGWIEVVHGASVNAPTTAAAIEAQTPTDVSFGANVTAKKVCIEITKTTNDYATVAEVELVPVNSYLPTWSQSEYFEYLALRDLYTDPETGMIQKKISGSAWKATVNTTQNSRGETVVNGSGSQTINLAIDGNESSYWHSYYEASGSTITYHSIPPYTIEVTLPRKVVASGLSVLPRSDANNGCPLDMTVYVKASDSADYTLVREHETFQSGKDARVVDFGANIFVKKVKFVLNTTAFGYGCIREIDLVPWQSYHTFCGTLNYADYAPNTQLYRVVPASMTAWSNYPHHSTWKPENAVDGLDSTLWQTHSDYAHAKYYPFKLYIDLGTEISIQKLIYHPRQTYDLHGLWRQVNVLTSHDKETWTEQIHGMTMPKDLNDKVIMLPQITTCRYVCFEVTQSESLRASCGEIYVYQTKESYDRYWDTYGGKYTLSYGSDRMERSRLGKTEMVTLDGPMFAKNGWTYVPLKSFVNETGLGKATTIPGDDLMKLRVEMDERTFILEESNHLLYETDPIYGDGIQLTMHSLPMVIDGVFYAPLQFVVKLLAFDMKTNPDNDVLTLSKIEFDMCNTLDWIDPAEAFDELTYAVHYDAGMGTIAEGEDVSVKAGRAVTLPEATPMEGYTLRGWYRADRLRTFAGEAGESYTPESDVTLFAVYDEYDDYPDAVAAAESYFASIDRSLYRTAQQNEIEKIVTDTRQAIGNTKSGKTAYILLDEAKLQIAAIKTDAELTAEEDLTQYNVSIQPTTGGMVKDSDGMIRNGNTEEPTGSTITLTAIPEETGEFKAWIDSVTKKRFSEKPTYVFSVNTVRKLTALFADHSDANEHFVTFSNRSGQYIATNYVTTGENAADYAPSDLKMYSDGYTFTGWDIPLGPISVSTDFVGVYERKPALYRVLVENGKNSKGETDFTAGFDEKITLIADEAPEGKVFAGWELNGTLVSYKPTYSCYVFSSMNAKARFAESVVPTPLILMQNVTRGEKKDGKSMVSFQTTMDVPEGYTYVESGIVYVKTKASAGDLMLPNVGKTIDGKTVKCSLSTTGEPQYKLSASYGEAGITARGYLICLDGTGKRRVFYTGISYRCDTLPGGELEEDVDLD